MALGNEVGDAYIEVHADSRPFRRELKRDARRAGREAGGEMGKEITKGVDDELDDMFSRVGTRIRASLTRAGFRSGEGFGEAMKSGVEKSMKSWTKDLADSVVTGDFTKAAAKFDTLEEALDKIDRKLVSLRRGNRLTAEQFEDARKSLVGWGTAIREGKAAEAIDEAHAAALRLNTAMSRTEARENQRETLKLIDGIKKGLVDSERAYDESHRAAIARSKVMVADAAKQVQVNQDAVRTQEIMGNAHRRVTQDMIADRKEYFDQEIDGWLKTRRAAHAAAKGTEQLMRALSDHFRKNPVAGPDNVDEEGWRRALARVEQNTEVVVRRMGNRAHTGMLGSLRGARNNFLNLVGIVGGNIENLIGKGLDRAFDTVGGGIAKLGEKLVDLGGGSGPLAMVGDGITKLGDGLTGLGKGGIDGLLVQLVVLALAFQGFLLVVGPLVSGVTGLVGIFTALAVTIGGALIGAIGSLLPIIAALAIVVGAGVVGVMGMTDAMKDMLKPLQGWFDAVKTAVAANLFGNLQSQVDRLVGFLNSSVSPALDIAATALREFADGFLDMLNSPGVQMSMKVFRDSLPGILGNLGRIFNGVFAGITGIIAGAAPVVERFLDYIADIAEEFGNWANTEKGRDAIRDFFEKAATAAETLFDIVGSLGGIFGTLFDEGSATGQKMLDTFADALETFNEWLGSKEGRDELASWFTYAEELAGKLGDIMGSLGELWDALDTPMNRQLFLDLLDGVNGLIDALTWMAETGEDIIFDVAGAFTNLKEKGAEFSTWLDELLNFDWSAIWNTITSPFTTAWDWITGWFEDTPGKVEDGFHELFNIDWAAVGQAIFTGLSTALTFGLTALFTVGIGIIDWFIQLPGRIGTALSTLGTIIGMAFSTAFQFVLGIITTAVANIFMFITSIPATIGLLLSVLPGVISGWFSTAWNTAYTTVVGIVTGIIAFVSSVPATLGAILSALPGVIGGAFSRAWTAALTAVTGAIATIIGVVAAIPGRIGAALSSLWSVITGAFSRAWNSATTETRGRIEGLISTIAGIPRRAAAVLAGIGGTLVQAGRNLVQGLINGVSSMIGRVADTIINAIRNIRLPAIQAPKINMPSIPKINWPWTATGGIFNGAQGRIIGEAGPEAVVPLNRPLSQVDPAVRALSAYAQGKNVNSAGGSGNTTNEITVVTPYSDPGLVALEVMDALTERAR